MDEDNDKTKERKPREIFHDELEKIREAHLKWLRSQGKEGEQAELLKANLRDADLRDADLRKASLRKANLRKANLYSANLQEAELTEANLQEAFLFEANLKEADLMFANLQEAELRDANLQKAYLGAANFEGADVTGVEYNRQGHYQGIRVATCYGSPRFKRFAQDQDFIEELRDSGWRGKVIYYIWLILADCGRSLWNWLAWSMGLAISFGYIFFRMGPDAFHVKEPLPYSLGTMIYYSVVTFTTLGFGDITPKTSTAAWWVMAEVVFGYIMLGGLISILATKLARRS